MKKKCIVIYTEGETEEEFYNLLLETIKEKYHIKKFAANEIIKKCIKGICKFENKLLNKFKKEVIANYKDYEIIVYLCYDTDVFCNSQNPPINREKLEKSLLELGANKVYHIKAKNCIEDIFLYDINGVCKFLKINPVKRITGKNGVEKMEKLFKNANRIYQKGYSCENLVRCLDMEIILSKINKQIAPLLEELLPNKIKEEVLNK